MFKLLYNLIWNAFSDQEVCFVCFDVIFYQEVCFDAIILLSMLFVCNWGFVCFQKILKVDLATQKHRNNISTNAHPNSIEDNVKFN